MALQGPHLGSPQLVGNKLTRKYYGMPNQFHEAAYPFYEMIVTEEGLCEIVMRDIYEKKLFLFCDGIKKLLMKREDFPIKILTVDTPEMPREGIILVVVTGYLIALNMVKKCFTQRFVLVPRNESNTSYFVVNDIFEFTEELDLTASAFHEKGISKVLVLPDEGKDVNMEQKLFNPDWSLEEIPPYIIKKACNFTCDPSTMSSNIVGRTGEEVAFVLLKDIYGEENVVWVNQVKEMYHPYDIKIHEKENKVRFVEVKSTKYTEKISFIPSTNEWTYLYNHKKSVSIAHVILGPSEVKLIFFEDLLGSYRTKFSLQLAQL